MKNKLSAGFSRFPFFPMLLVILVSGPVFAVEKNLLTIETATRDLELQIELADTAEERSKGLMYRTDLPEMEGMLFDFQRNMAVSMWMKNTRISLDMFFIDEAGKIVFIRHRAEPGSLEGISANQPVRAVLELVGGFAQKHGVVVGDRIRHPLFKNNL